MSDWVGLDQWGLLDYFVKQQAILCKANPVPLKGECVRVCTYNVHFWLNPHFEPNCSAILETIRSVDADILVLQEFMLRTSDRFIHPAATEMCVKDLEKMGYLYHTFAERPVAPDGFLVVVFSKLPLSDICYVPLGGARHAAVATVCVPSSKHKYNSRLNDQSDDLNMKQPPDTRAKTDGEMKVDEKIRRMRVWGVHLDVSDESERIRIAQSRVLLTTIATSNYERDWPLLLGDFNALSRDDYTDAQWGNIDTHDKLRGVPPITELMSMFSRFSLSPGASLPWSSTSSACFCSQTSASCSCVSSSTRTVNTNVPSTSARAAATGALNITTTSSWASFFVDSFLAAKKTPPTSTTWSQRRIDYIFADSNWCCCVENSGIVFSAASDHLPVFADLRV